MQDKTWRPTVNGQSVWRRFRLVPIILAVVAAAALFVVVGRHRTGPSPSSEPHSRVPTVDRQPAPPRVNPSNTYTPSRVGPVTVSVSSGGALADPEGALVSATAAAVSTYTVSGPDRGEVGAASRPFTVTLGPGAVSGAIRVTPTASGGDGTFMPASAVLTNSSRSATFVYTPGRWGPRTVTVANDRGLPEPTPLPFLGMVQLGSSGTAPRGNRAPSFGGFDLLANGYLAELKRDITGDPVDPTSDALIALVNYPLHLDFSTTTAKGGNSLYGIPYNIVSGNQPAVPLTITAYQAESDPGPAPFPATASVEGYYDPAGKPPASDPGGDRHILVAVRNETTGGIDTLWEYQTAWTEDGGATWKAHGGARFNIATGEPRPDTHTSADAAGLPILPLLLRYDEVAAGDVGHAIRVSIKDTATRNKYVWPARHTAYSGTATAGIPFGARLRLKKTWYDANKGSFTGQARFVLDAMRKYGLINADITGSAPNPYVMGVNDERWDMANLLTLQTVTGSAFEVTALRPGWTITGPSSGPVGRPATFTVTHHPAGDKNFNVNIYLNVDGGTTGLSVTSVPLNDGSRSGTFTYTPAKAGPHTISGAPGGQDWFPPSPLTFTATARPAASRQPTPLNQLTPLNRATGPVGRSPASNSPTSTGGSAKPAASSGRAKKGITATTVKDGNWSNPTVWSTGVVPGAGDVAVIRNNITITSDTTIGDGTATTVLSCATTGSSLTVTGAKLTIRGNATFGAYNGGNVRLYLDVANSGAAPGGIELDGNASVTPTISFDFDSMLRIKGIPSGRCFLRTKPDSAGNPAQVKSLGGVDRSLFVDAGYADFSRLGDASNPGINAPTASSWASGPRGYGRPPFRFAHCTFDSCGKTPSVNLGASGQIDFDLEVTNCSWTNSAAGDYLCQIQVNGNLAVKGGKRLIHGNQFYGLTPFFPAPRGFTITSNYFDDNLVCAGGTNLLWASFDGNFVRLQRGAVEHQWGGGATNNYMLGNPVVSDSPDWHFLLIPQGGDSTFSANVFQCAGSATADHSCIGETEADTGVRTCTITHNIMLSGFGRLVQTNSVDGARTNVNGEHHSVIEHQHRGRERLSQLRRVRCAGRPDDRQPTVQPGLQGRRRGRDLPVQER